MCLFSVRPRPPLFVRTSRVICLLTQPPQGSEVFDSIKYSVWSEEVTPPVLGWRVRGHREAASPAPMINPVIGSMMHLEGMVHPMTVEKRMKDMLVQDGVVTEDGGVGDTSSSSC